MYFRLRHEPQQSLLCRIVEVCVASAVIFAQILLRAVHHNVKEVTFLALPIPRLEASSIEDDVCIKKPHWLRHQTAMTPRHE